MPEGPECYSLAYRLNKWLAGARIQSIEIIGGRYHNHGAPDGFEPESDLISGNCTIQGSLKREAYILDTG